MRVCVYVPCPCSCLCVAVCHIYIFCVIHLHSSNHVVLHDNTHSNARVWLPARLPTYQVEKSLLKAEVEGDVSGVKDIVRAMATVSQMLSVARLLRLLRKMHEEGVIIVLRVKERFLRSPSGSVLSGYRIL